MYVGDDVTSSITNNQTHVNKKFLKLISKYLYSIEYLVFFFFGVFYVKVSEQSEAIGSYVNAHIKFIGTKSYFDVFCYCFGFCFSLVIIGLFFALTLHGKYLLHIIFSYISFLFGVVCSSLYKAYLFSGFVGFLHYFLPFCIVLLLFGVLIFDKAGQISGIILKKLKGQHVDFKLKNYVLFFVLISAVLLMLSLIFAVYIRFL